MKKHCLLILAVVAVINSCFSQAKMTAAQEAVYSNVIIQRADKIVALLGLKDSSEAHAIGNIIAAQYRDLNNVYAKRDDAKKQIEPQNLSKLEQDKRKQEIDSIANEHLAVLHNKYIASLSQKLSAEQVDKIKDGMTYNVCPITYKAYQEMIPSLTPPQKVQILAWLIEAREHAMDAESSEKKHAWFGKYKGRINNYLSAQGYDSKKEREEWEKRLKAQNKNQG